MFARVTVLALIFAAAFPPVPAQGLGAPVSYAYDASAPLEYGVEATQQSGGIRLSDVSFRSGRTIVHATLVAPQHERASMPGVLFAHWLGEPATTNRTEFLEDAKWLARRGVVSLVPDQPWSQAHWFESIRSTARDDADSIAEVIALRRSLDVLAAHAGVDTKRLAFVGHDFGAMYGALLATADTRPRVFVFMAPTITFAEWFLLDTRRPPSDPGAYAAKMSAFDIPQALEHQTVPVLLQFATHDAYVPRPRAERLAAACASPEKTVRFYDADHALASADVTDERRAWLATHLDLP